MEVYDSINQEVLAEVPQTARRILDVGCGCGGMGAEFRRRQGAEVVGLTFSVAEGQEAKKVLNRVVVQDLNHFVPQDLGRFDCVVCSHVLEHLISPPQLLHQLRAVMQPGATLVIAVPNVLFWRQRLEFLCGRFRYTRGGLMDDTHLRFFDVGSLPLLVGEAGFRVRSTHTSGSFPGTRFLPGAMKRAVDRLALKAAPGWFGFQIVLRAELAD